MPRVHVIAFATELHDSLATERALLYHQVSARTAFAIGIFHTYTSYLSSVAPLGTPSGTSLPTVLLALWDFSFSTQSISVALCCSEDAVRDAEPTIRTTGNLCQAFSQPQVSPVYKFETGMTPANLQWQVTKQQRMKVIPNWAMRTRATTDVFRRVTSTQIYYQCFECGLFDISLLSLLVFVRAAARSACETFCSFRTRMIVYPAMVVFLIWSSDPVVWVVGWYRQVASFIFQRRRTVC